MKMLARIVAYISFSYTHTQTHNTIFHSGALTHVSVRALGLVTGVGIELGVCLVRE